MELIGLDQCANNLLGCYIGATRNNNHITYTNGLELTDVVTCIVNTCIQDTRIKPNVISNFFGLNPDGTAPNNIAYSFSQNCLQDLVLFDFYDVAKYNGSALDLQTSIGYMSFCKLMDIMKIFNVKFVLDDGQVRLEHVSILIMMKLVWI